MKSLIPWIVVVVLLGGVYFLYSAGKSKDERLAQLSQESDELVKLRAENEDLKKRAPQEDEINRLRKENEELPRLRSLVQQLRHTTADLTNQVQSAQRSEAQKEAQLTAQNDALKAQQEAARVAAQTAAQNQAAATQSAACVNNLRQLEAAKQTWAQDHGKPPGSLPSPAELQAYLPQNVFPACPAGGAYSINALGVPATCTIPGHSLALANRYGNGVLLSK